MAYGTEHKTTEQFVLSYTGHQLDVASSGDLFYQISDCSAVAFCFRVPEQLVMLSCLAGPMHLCCHKLAWTVYKVDITFVEKGQSQMHSGNLAADAFGSLAPWLVGAGSCTSGGAAAIQSSTAEQDSIDGLCLCQGQERFPAGLLRCTDELLAPTSLFIHVGHHCAAHLGQMAACTFLQHST